MDRVNEIANSLEKFKTEAYVFERFQSAVINFFKTEPQLNTGHVPVIHSIKSRTKDISHLEDKLNRKWDAGVEVQHSNIFEHITDLVGVRVLHLYQDQFSDIHEAIMRQIQSGDWHLKESPKAFSWDPETSDFFISLGLKTEIRATYYTSIHYVVKPKADSDVCCEIQVRTLFEEIWGEVDLALNYPHPTDILACKEQIRVLSKLVSTGTRLADSIFRTQAAK